MSSDPTHQLKTTLSRAALQAQQTETEKNTREESLKKKHEEEAQKAKKHIAKERRRTSLDPAHPEKKLKTDTKLKSSRGDKCVRRSDDSVAARRRKRHRSPEIEEAPEVQFDPTLEANGHRGRRILTHPSDQSVRIREGPHYPDLSIKTSTIRPIEKIPLRSSRLERDAINSPKSLLATSLLSSNKVDLSQLANYVNAGMSTVPSSLEIYARMVDLIGIWNCY